MTSICVIARSYSLIKGATDERLGVKPKECALENVSNLQESNAMKRTSFGSAKLQVLDEVGKGLNIIRSAFHVSRALDAESTIASKL